MQNVYNNGFASAVPNHDTIHKSNSNCFRKREIRKQIKNHLENNL